MKAPVEVMKTRMDPTIIAGYVRGRVTVRKARHRLAPRSYAASRRMGSTLDREANRGRTMKGSQTYMSVKTTIWPVPSGKKPAMRELNPPRPTLLSHLCTNDSVFVKGKTA